MIEAITAFPAVFFPPSAPAPHARPGSAHLSSPLVTPATSAYLLPFIYRSSLLPNLGFNLANIYIYMCWMVDDECRIWGNFLILLVFYTAWVSPFQFGFNIGHHGPLAITNNVVNGFFAIDIVLTFFVAFLDKTTYLLVDDHKQIALRYAKSWLIFDVVSTIPSELALKVLPLSYDYISVLRLWRLHRVSTMFQR